MIQLLLVLLSRIWIKMSFSANVFVVLCLLLINLEALKRSFLSSKWLETRHPFNHFHMSLFIYWYFSIIFQHWGTLPHRRKWPFYPAYPMPWLLMPWQRKEAEDMQPSYWPRLQKIPVSAQEGLIFCSRFFFVLCLFVLFCFSFMEIMSEMRKILYPHVLGQIGGL